MRASRIRTALNAIARKHNGLLRPADVVDAARAAKHPLHNSFTWDDAAAGAEYRIWQARQLIRVTVCILPEGGDREIRAYVSMKEDRARDGGGYRVFGDMMSDPELRTQVLREALEELSVFKRKYRRLQELAPVFEAAESVGRAAAK